MSSLIPIHGVSLWARWPSVRDVGRQKDDPDHIRRVAGYYEILCHGGAVQTRVLAVWSRGGPLHKASSRSNNPLYVKARSGRPRVGGTDQWSWRNGCSQSKRPFTVVWPTAPSNSVAGIVREIPSRHWPCEEGPAALAKAGVHGTMWRPNMVGP